jgi:ribonuclease P/MRP protein subunit RPP40
LKCIYFNAFSIVSKFDRLVSEVHILKPDIIGITESWANSDISDSELHLDGYDLFRCDRPIAAKGGGVLLYVSEDLHAVECTFTTSFPEHVWCTIKNCNLVDLTVGVCYRTPTDRLYTFDLHDSLRKLVKEVSTRHFILMGDFNYRGIDWLYHTNIGNDVHEQLFFECLEEGMLTQHVTRPTTNKSVLDLIITREPDLVTDICDLGNFASSDHHLLQWSLNVSVSKPLIDRLTFNYNKMNTAAIKKELLETDWNSLLTGTANDCWLAFKHRLDDLRLKYVPVGRRSRHGRTKKVWMTYRAAKYVRKKYRVFAKYKDNKHPAYVAAERKAKQAVKDAKWNFEKKLAENIKKDTKSFFTYVRSRSKAKPKTGPLLDEHGEDVADTKKMAEIFNDYFTTVFTAEDVSNLPNVGALGTTEMVLNDITVTEEIVRDKLCAVREDKAAGPDDLLPRFLAAVRQEICKPVCMIFKQSLAEASVPADWKEANVCPIYKTGGKGKASNYRPVSLTCQLCKVFESIVRDEMVLYLENNKLIHDSQHGFRKGKSCLSNLLSFLDQVTRTMDLGFSMDAIYLDFAKAFDKVPHKRLIMKLRNHGIGGRLLSWIEDWLKDRRQRVCLQGEESDWKSVLSGVPQGSVLGPVLFLVYINDLDIGITNLIYKFADDTKLLAKVDSAEEHDKLQDDLNTLVSWSKDWQMKFNTDKCKVMHFGSSNNQFDYYMEGHALNSVTNEKDLGVEVTADLKNTAHCIRAYKKANRVLGMIYRTISYKSQEIMLSLYKTLVRPHLEYCVSAWSPCYKKDKVLLEKIQHRFTRMIKPLRHLDYNERLNLLKLWTLQERRNRGDLIEVFKMYKGFINVAFADFFTLDTNAKGTRGHSAKLVKVRCERELRRHFFSNRVVNRWNALDEGTVAAASVGAFKGRLSKLRENEMGFFLDNSD